MKCEVCGIDFEPCKSTAKWQKTCSKKCRRVRNNREHAEYLSGYINLEKDLVSLPLHLGLTDEDINRVIDTVKRGW